MVAAKCLVLGLSSIYDPKGNITTVVNGLLIMSNGYKTSKHDTLVEWHHVSFSKIIPGIMCSQEIILSSNLDF